MDNYRSRKHCLLLYPDDKSHMKALEYIKQYFEYAYILHDKDFNEVGEEKKSHYHVIIQFKNAKWSNAICEELGIKNNYMQKCNNFELALEYLIHYNEETKFQYDIEEVKGPLKNKLRKFLNSDNKDDGEKYIELYEYINTINDYIYLSDFVLYCAKMGYYDTYRRCAYTFIKIIEQHNLFYTTDRT